VAGLSLRPVLLVAGAGVPVLLVLGLLVLGGGTAFAGTPAADAPPAATAALIGPTGQSMSWAVLAVLASGVLGIIVGVVLRVRRRQGDRA
jgi:hypothetical protein